MPTIGVRELKTNVADVVRRAEAGESFVVTRRGKPVATILPCVADVEDLILAEAERFVKMRARARREYREGKTIDWTRVKRVAEPAPKYKATGKR